ETAGCNLAHPWRAVGSAEHGRSQNNWTTLHHHGVCLSGLGWGARIVDEAAACGSRATRMERRPVRPGLYYARLEHDVSVRGARDGSDGGVPGAFDGGEPQYCVSAAQCLLLLALPGRWNSIVGRFRLEYGP